MRDSLTKEQWVSVLELQKELNDLIDPEWREKNFDYMLAVVVEGGETIEHFGWKWWKEQKQNLPQVQMELVDIFHFYLCYELQYETNNNFIISNIVDELDFDFGYTPSTAFVRSLKIIILSASSGSLGPEWSAFSAAVKCSGMSWQDLYAQYVPKNVLNIFRQKHGYKTGEYRKHWADGREDNEHLVEIMEFCKPLDETSISRIYDGLETRYGVDYK